MVKIAIIHYSMFGHIAQMSEAVKKGIESVEGATCDIYQVAETLPEEMLAEWKAPPKGDYPIISPDKMAEYDGIMFGIACRFGMLGVQLRAFLDSTAFLWQNRALLGKAAGCFFSTAVQGGGQETLGLTTVTYFAHHGMVFVPLGFIDEKMFSTDEVHGASAYGCGTISGHDGSRRPTELELAVAETHGKHFASITAKLAS